MLASIKVENGISMKFAFHFKLFESFSRINSIDFQSPFYGVTGPIEPSAPFQASQQEVSVYRARALTLHPILCVEDQTVILKILVFEQVASSSLCYVTPPEILNLQET